MRSAQRGSFAVSRARRCAGSSRLSGVWRELLRQPWVERGVVGQPLERCVGEDHVDRLRGLPGGDVGHVEVHAGHALARGLDHVVGAVDAADQRIGKTLRQHFGGVAGAAAQVDGGAHIALRQGGHEVAYGAGALFFEGRILLG